MSVVTWCVAFNCMRIIWCRQKPLMRIRILLLIGCGSGSPFFHSDANPQHWQRKTRSTNFIHINHHSLWRTVPEKQRNRTWARRRERRRPQTEAQRRACTAVRCLRSTACNKPDITVTKKRVPELQKLKLTTLHLQYKVMNIFIGEKGRPRSVCMLKYVVSCQKVTDRTGPDLEYRKKECFEKVILRLQRKANCALQEY